MNMHGHNSTTIDTADWAAEVTRSKAHAYIKLIVHTLRVLIKAGEADIEISDAELSHMTSLSLKTVQRYRQLAKDEGWLDTKPGVGRSKVTFYRVSVPMKTLSELESRLTALTKNRSDRPLIDENKSRSPTDRGKQVSQTAIENENRSGSPTVGEVKKEIPPTPPKEKTTTFKTNNHPSLETAGAVEVQGLNGATAHIVKTLGEWINPIMPDRKTAHGWLESSVSMYGGSIVRDSFAELESKILHGDIVARPIPLLTKICQRRAAAKPGNSRDPTEKPAGMPEKLWREIQAGKAKAPA